MTETGNKLTLSKTSFGAGKYTFVVTNKGHPHRHVQGERADLSGSSKNTVAPARGPKRRFGRVASLRVMPVGAEAAAFLRRHRA